MPSSVLSFAIIIAIAVKISVSIIHIDIVVIRIIFTNKYYFGINPVATTTANISVVVAAAVFVMLMSL